MLMPEGIISSLFLKFVRRLLDPENAKSDRRVELTQEIHDTPALADRQWLLQQIAQ